MKGIVLAGGTGSRMAPATHFVNKHLLPVYSSEGAVPMLYYPIRTLINSGITDILIVSSPEHCGRIIEHLSDGKDSGANFTYKIQDPKHVPMGIASALKLAEDFTKYEPFAVILGDNYFEDSFPNEMRNFLRPEIEAAIFLKEVADPTRFGVYTDGKIEEKPANPKSNWAVTGLYLYTPHVYTIAEKLVPSKRGELEITDINNWYCENHKIQLNYVENFWSDMGVPESIMNTQNHLGNKS